MKPDLTKIGITAGPWERGYHANGCEFVKKDGRDIKIADVYGEHRTGNANLIAAAPEMLVTLIEALLAAEQYYEPIRIGEHSRGKIQAVIEKATGLPWPELKEELGL